MELPENATEDVVGRIKERKMGRLFENQTINIPAMQREAEKLRQEIEKSKKEVEESKKEVEKSKKEVEESKKEVEKSKREVEESKKEAEESKKDAERIRAIYKRISKLTWDGVEHGVIRETVIREYSLTENEAKDIFEDFE